MPELASATVPGWVGELLLRAEDLAFDTELTSVREWKAAVPGRKVVGYMPVYVPREIPDAAGILPVGIMGGGDRVEIIRGDAYFQSYLCHLPRSTIELAVAKRLDVLDGMLFPAICDVIRNLSGMWQILYPDRYVHYFDFPQAEDPRLAQDFYRDLLAGLRDDMGRLAGRPVPDAELRRSIARYDTNRALIRDLDARRLEAPWQIPASDAYLVVRAGHVLPVEAHNAMLAAYLDGADAVTRPRLDNSRVVLRGSFCEQPPLALLRTLERSGCDIVDDDCLMGPRWLTAPVGDAGDPLDALAAAFVHHSAPAASKYAPGEARGAGLVATVKRTQAEGVIFCAPSFCDPALLDQPMLQAACDRAGIPYTTFKYSEDTGQFQVIREQAGTFADSIRLWSQP